MLEARRQRQTEAETADSQDSDLGASGHSHCNSQEGLSARREHSLSGNIKSAAPEEEPSKKTQNKKEIKKPLKKKKIQNRYNPDSENYKYILGGIMKTEMLTI